MQTFPKQLGWLQFPYFLWHQAPGSLLKASALLCTPTDLIGLGSPGSKCLTGSPGILMQISWDCF